jgi:hypothetical protein
VEIGQKRKIIVGLGRLWAAFRGYGMRSEV